MSLSWNVENVKDHKEVCYDDTGSLSPVTELLIFTTMHVGLGSITEKNADEFYARMLIVHKLHDIGIMIPDGTEQLKPEDIRKHIGLYTNVSNETRAQWTKRMFNDKNTSITADNARHYRREIKRLEEKRLKDAALAS